eukprot:XP_008179133.1 PREDICTED: uncharacterized protein LOC100569710 [Acyrthosiphon pisum]
MGYYDLVPNNSSSLLTIKKKIRKNSIVTLFHGIVFFFWIMFSDPWPSSLRDPGFIILLNFLIYLFIVNLLNGLFLYDEYLERTKENQEFGSIFHLCKTVRHILFWTYGVYIYVFVICIGIYKLCIV